MRAIKVFISFLLLFTTQSFAATGAASVYKVTITKIELCENATINSETSYTTSGCITVGTGNLTVDIASASAGAEIAKFADTSTIPIGKTYRWAQPTLSRQFSIAGSVAVTKIIAGTDAVCATNENNDSGGFLNIAPYQSMQMGTFDGTPSEVTVYTPDETTSGYHCVTSNCSTALGSRTFNHDLPDDTSTYGHAVDVTEGETTFKMIYLLGSPYIRKDISPKITIKFGTSASVEAFPISYPIGVGDKCVIGPYWPKVSITLE